VGEYEGLLKILSPLLAWFAVGWALFPTLASNLSEIVNEPLDAARIGAIAYPVSFVCIGLSVFFWWRAHRF